MNIKFSYRYRDYSNYKNFGEIIFSNPAAIPLNEIETIIKNHLIDGEWFYSTEWNVPDLHFDTWDPDDDHFLHEFAFVEETGEPSNSDITISSFISTIKKARNHYI